MLQGIAKKAVLSRDLSCKHSVLLDQARRWQSIWGSPAQTPQVAEPATSTDYIHLKGMTFHGYHGVLPEVRL